MDPQACAGASRKRLCAPVRRFEAAAVCAWPCAPVRRIKQRFSPDRMKETELAQNSLPAHRPWNGLPAHHGSSRAASRTGFPRSTCPDISQQWQCGRVPLGDSDGRRLRADSRRRAGACAHKHRDTAMLIRTHQAAAYPPPPLPRPHSSPQFTHPL